MRTFRPIVNQQIKIAVFDIETYKWIYPYSVAFYDGHTYKKFTGQTCVSDFLREIIRHKYRAFTIFAHNGGRFDFNFLIETLKKWNYDIKMIFQGSRCLQIKVFHQKEGKTKERKSRNATKFSDSYSLLKFSLDKLTKDFNVKHKKLNFMTDGKKNDYEYLYELYKKKDPRFYDYIKNDVFGLYEVLKKFNNIIQEKQGQMSLTIASTALKTFQHGYLNHKIKMTNRQTNDEMKQAYYGGRTEIFRMYLPDNHYYCYDINSLYPHVMFNNEFPVSPPREIKNITLTDIKELLGITKCKVKAPKDIYIPVLPVHHEINRNRKLIFPTGTFTGYWDNIQLKKALELGYKIEPIKGWVFKGEKIFKDYVHKFYDMKLKSKKDTPSYVISKLLLNSLYGKFAQRQDSEMIMKITDPKEAKKYEIVGILDPDYNMYRVKCESKGNFFIPQISIHVTALAQLHLYKLIEQVIAKDKIIAYCDTDSIFTDMKMNIGDKLGQLKLEYPFYKGYFLLPKTYCIIKHDGQPYIRAKGYTNEFQEQIKEKTFKEALFNKNYAGFNIESNLERFNTMKTSHVRHNTFVSTDIIRKSIKSIYDKRIVKQDFDTIPIKL